jgi:hypothetical protein
MRAAAVEGAALRRRFAGARRSTAAAQARVPPQSRLAPATRWMARVNLSWFLISNRRFHVDGHRLPAVADESAPTIALKVEFEVIDRLEAHAGCGASAPRGDLGIAGRTSILLPGMACPPVSQLPPVLLPGLGVYLEHATPAAAVAAVGCQRFFRWRRAGIADQCRHRPIIAEGQ